MQIERRRRKLKNGEERIYTYAVSSNGERRSLSILPVEDQNATLYRSTEKRRIMAALQANSSLLVVGESGIGKTYLGEVVAHELEQLGFTVAIARPLTVKQSLLDLANQLGVDTQSIEGKIMNTAQLAIAIAESLQQNHAFLICDDAQRYTVQFRAWLEDLHDQGQPLLLLATFPPARDIFLRLPRIELKPLSDRAIRAIMQESALALGLELTSGQLAHLQQRCAGNPMLAQRVVKEEYLGLDEPSPDHTQWIDGTPFLIAGLMVFVVVRFIGLGMNSTTLYLIGGIITVAIGIIRLLIASMPRKSSRLGQ
jgi:AAA domain